jgi:hypothetical protein
LAGKEETIEAKKEIERRLESLARMYETKKSKQAKEDTVDEDVAE